MQKGLGAALGVASLAGLCVTGAWAAGKPARNEVTSHGHVLFLRQCAPCHGQGKGDDGAPLLPGTAALKLKYKGDLPPELEKRRDLTAETIRFFVRNGSGAMPMFRRTELSDADINAINAYLKKSGSAL